MGEGRVKVGLADKESEGRRGVKEAVVER